jgi:segregation and condensation protein B
MEEKTLDPKRVAEAALFMATEPMDLQSIAAIMGLGAVGQAKKAMDELIEEYQGNDSALEIVFFEEKYRMKVKDDYLPRVAHLTLSTDYSKAALKTLSVIAFKQPILQSEVIKIRGDGAYEHIKELTGGSLLSAKPQGRSKLLATTKKFEEYFGTSVEKLKETYGNIEFYVPEEKEGERAPAKEGKEVGKEA